MNLSRRNAILTMLAAAASSSVRAATSSGAVPIRYATGGGIGPNELETVIFLPWMQKNVLKRYGKDYTLDFTFTRGTPEAAGLLAAAQVDMATLSFSAFANALAKNAVPGGMKIVCDNYENGKPGFASDAVLVRSDGPVQTVEDLRGRKVGVNAFGSASDLVVRIMLKKHGIDPRHDLQMVEIAFANIGPAIREQRIDAGIMILPFLSDELTKGGLKTLFTAGDSLGTYAVLFQVATNAFLSSNSDAVRAFLADYIEGAAWISRPENRSTVMRVTSEFTKSPAERLDRYFLTSRDYYRSSSGCVDPVAVQAPVDAMAREGLLAAPIDMKSHIDLSYLPGPC